MKNIFSIAAFLFISSSSFAGVDVVYSDYDLALGQIKIDNACLTAHEVRSIKPVEVCTKLVPHTHVGNGEDSTYTEWTCAQKVTSILSMPRAFKRTVCVDYKTEADNMYCAQTAQVNDFVPNVIKVSRAKNVYSSSTNWPGVVSYVTLPACK